MQLFSHKLFYTEKVCSKSKIRQDKSKISKVVLLTCQAKNDIINLYNLTKKGEKIP